jgi:hypothetical protein
MNEEIVDQIYNVLVERFNIDEVFLPKFGKSRLKEITWRQFIKAALELDAAELYKYCGYSNLFSFSTGLKRKHLGIFQDKNGTQWCNYLLLLINRKSCPTCSSIKDITTGFGRNINQSGGIRSECKACEKDYRDLNREHRYMLRSDRYQQNKEHELKQGAIYRAANKESISLRRNRYYIAHKPEAFARAAKRRADKLRATPNWVDLEKVKQIYRDRPDGYHVDHIVPLHHPLVCGLHCEFNLQHLPASENLSKSNKFEVG